MTHEVLDNMIVMRVLILIHVVLSDSVSKKEKSASTHTHIWIHICIYACMYVCTYVCIDIGESLQRKH